MTLKLKLCNTQMLAVCFKTASGYIVMILLASNYFAIYKEKSGVAFVGLLEKNYQMWSFPGRGQPSSNGQCCSSSQI